MQLVTVFFCNTYIKEDFIYRFLNGAANMSEHIDIKLRDNQQIINKKIVMA